MNRKLHIMIVDDNPHARKALSAFISTQDWLEIVSEASNGKDAIDMLECQTPDMVLMDGQMPVMDGFEATRIIKERWPQIKVIVLTIYMDYQLRAQKVGADAFLVKGCSTEEMTTAIRSLN